MLGWQNLFSFELLAKWLGLASNSTPNERVSFHPVIVLVHCYIRALSDLVLDQMQPCTGFLLSLFRFQGANRPVVKCLGIPFLG